MPIFGKSQKAQEILASQGPLKPHQSRAVAQAMALGINHYNEPWMSPHTGEVLCPSNPRRGPCLHKFGQQTWHAPGKGKTLTVLEHHRRVVEFLKSKNDPRASLPTLLITINSVKWNIASLEIPKWRPDLLQAGKVVVIDGDRGVRTSLFDLMENNHIQPELIIFTYSHLSKTTEGVFDFLQGGDYLGFYRDESASETSNPYSQRAMRCNAIKRGYVINMSGSPQRGYPNKVWEQWQSAEPGRYMPYKEPVCKPNLELCPLPAYLQERFRGSCKGCKHWRESENNCQYGANKDPNPLGLRFWYSPSPNWRSYEAFCDRYCLDGNKGSKNEAELHSRMMASGMVSIERWAASDKPPIIYQPLMPNPDQAKLMLRLANGLRDWLAKAEDGWEQFSRVGSTSFLSAITHLRRASTMSPDGFKRAYGGYSAQISRVDDMRLEGDSCKMEWLQEFIQVNVKDTSNSIIIGSEWTDMLAEVRALLEAMGVEKLHVASKFSGTEMSLELPRGDDRLFYAQIDGSLSDKQRTAIQEAFNRDKRLKYVIMSGAGYKGMNLKGAGGPDDTVFVAVLGVSWTPTDIEQIRFRAKREDSVSRVVIYVPVTVYSIDEFVHEVIYGKAVSAEKVIYGQENGGREFAAFGLRELVSQTKDFLDDSIKKLESIK